MKRTVLSLCLIVFAAQVQAQISSEQHAPLRFNGIPFYQIFEEKDIEDTARGNFITSSPDGRLFFGNESGIHTFDGTSWKLILQTPATRDKVRSIFWTEYGTFAAGYGTIGRLLFNEENGVRYQPVNDTPLTNDASEVYSKILRNDNELFFIGLRSIVRYDLATETITAHSFDSWVKGSIVFDKKLHIATSSDGVIAFDQDNAIIQPQFSKFVDNNVITIFEQNKAGETLFVTQSNQVFKVAAKGKLDEFKPFDYNPEGQIRDIEFLRDDLLALSISGKGISVITPTGAPFASLENTIDYRWATASFLHADSQGTLWTLFNSTVGKILIDCPLTQIDERLRPTVVYPLAHEYDHKIYLRNEGKLYTTQHAPSGLLEKFVNAFPDSTLSISAVLAAPDGLYIHTESKTYLYSNNQLEYLGDNGRIDRITTFKSDPNRLLAISSTEIKILQRSGNSLETVATTPHSAGLVNKIACSPNNVFWLEIGLGQVGKVWLENGQPKFKLYTDTDGLPPDWIAIWEHGDRVLFTESSGIYCFDETTSRFSPTSEFEEHFPSGNGPIHRIATDPSGNIWASYDHFNYILWKQADGTYNKDNHSLSQLGELYANQFKFLQNGDTLISTATELFHLDATLIENNPHKQTGLLSLQEISNIEGSKTLYANPGNKGELPVLDLAKGQRNLSFRVSNTNSSTLERPSFQYKLDGMSKDWSKWSASNEFSFAKLEYGNFTLRVRSRYGDESNIQYIEIPFSIAPTFWETPIAYLLYFIGAALALNFGYSFFARNLKHANEKLENMVAERTREIESKNGELQTKANELTDALKELRNAQDMLMNTSRKAGMAEVATNVLHNVGNVLNSINVSALALSERLEHERISKLTRVSELINSQADDLGNFLTLSARGKAIPAYLTQLSQVLRDDFAYLQIEVDCMNENIEHVKKIISTQQEHAKTVDVFQTVKIPELIESAITMIMEDSEHCLFEVSRNFEPNLEIVSDKHRILQMVANFIKNAKESIEEANIAIGLISISANISDNEKCIRIQISDNGIGISKENSRKVFTHGFTTKQNGHGFGMHSCANSAKVLGGELQIESEGLNKGATVTLKLPLAPPRKRKVAAKNRIPTNLSFSQN